MQRLAAVEGLPGAQPEKRAPVEVAGTAGLDEDMDLVQIRVDMQRAAGCPALDIVALVELAPAGMRGRIPRQI